VKPSLSILSRLVVAGTGSAFLRRMQDAMKVRQYIAVCIEFKMLASSCSVRELGDMKALGADLRALVTAGIDPISLHVSYSLDELVAAGADVADIIVSCACCQPPHPSPKTSAEIKNFKT
jgi:hypothetical protein